MMKKFTLLLTALLCVSALTSCGIGFNRDWSKAIKSTPANAIEGAWQGTWHSVPTGHTGYLRCIVSPAKNKQGDRLFTYHARWGRILSGTFRAEHRVVMVSGRSPHIAFEGRHQLPDWAGGLYHYKGSVSSDGKFSATYKCAKDHGSFEMSRPVP